MRKRRILVVEDVSIIREPIAIALEKNGYRVIQASSGEQALDILRKSITPIDLILLDYRMPGMNGISCLRSIRSNPGWRDLMVIMLTDTAEKDVVVEAQNLGVHAYMLKSSFSLEELEISIRKEVAGKGELPKTLELGHHHRTSILTKVPRARTLAALTDYVGSRKLSALVSELITALSSPRTPSSAIARAIEQEPSLSARLIRYASCGDIDRRQEVDSIVDAIEILGPNIVRNILVSIGILNVPEDRKRVNLETVRMCQRCFASGRLMESFQAGDTHYGAGYLFGVSYGLIRMLLQQYFPNEYAAVLNHSLIDERPLYDALPEVFGASQFELFSQVINGLDIPKSVRSSIEELFPSASLDGAVAHKLNLTIRFLEHYWASLLFDPGHIAPFTKFDLGTIGGKSNFILKPKDLKNEIVQSTLAIAEIDGVEGQAIGQTLFPFRDGRVHYVRSAHFADPDPIEIALGSLIEIERLEQLPTPEKLENSRGIVMVSAEPAMSRKALGAYQTLVEKSFGTQKIPILHLSPEAQGKSNASANVEYLDYPLPTSRLAKFLGRI